MRITVLLIVSLWLCSCAGTVQTNTARALLTIHDTIKTSAIAADQMCDQHIIPPSPCHEIKLGYDAFKEEWPRTNDSLQQYLLTPTTTSEEAFFAHYKEFMGLYQQLFSALLKNKVIAIEGGN